MRKLSVLLLSFCIFGCSAYTPPRSEVVTGDTHGADMNNTKWIAEAGVYIDYVVDNFYDWHYEGRDRAPTKEEIVLYELRVAEAKAKRDYDYYRIDAISEARTALQVQYAPILQRLAQQDSARFQERVEVLAKNRQPSSNIAGRP